jgi:hypothetical protein
MSALSNRHETQYFSRLSRLPLMEHSPTLKLIHTSEVQATAPNTQPDNSVAESTEPKEFEQAKAKDEQSQKSRLTTKSSSKVPEEDATAAGRAIILGYEREIEEHKKTMTTSRVRVRTTRTRSRVWVRATTRRWRV